MLEATDRHVVALTTAGSDDQADRIAKALVEKRLAACVNVVHGACSIYRWQGEVVRESEQVLVIKTTAGLLPRLEAAVRELHTYEVPEFLVLPVGHGSRAYLEWVTGSVDD